MDCRNIMGIATDTEAEELLLWIQEQSDLRDRLIETDKAMIQKYQDLMVKHEDGFKNTVDQAMMVLGEYCKNNPTKTTKTTTKLMLPSGTLQWKRREPKYFVDDVALLEWAKVHYSSLVKTNVVEKTDWSELKKQTQIVDNKVFVVTGDGEFFAVDGVELIPQDDIFEVKG